MVIAVFLLLVVGLCLVALEAITPFGIAGAVGAALILLSGWIAVREAGPLVGSAYCVVALGLALLVVRVMIMRARVGLTLRAPQRPRRSAGADRARAERAGTGPSAGTDAVGGIKIHNPSEPSRAGKGEPPREGQGAPRREPRREPPREPQTEPRVGDEARVAQPLRPTGTIVWAGRRLSARSLTPERETPIGAVVVIHGADSIYYLVEERAAE